MAAITTARPSAAPFQAYQPETIAATLDERRPAPCRWSAVCWKEGQADPALVRARVQHASGDAVGLLVRREIAPGTRLVVERRGPTGEVSEAARCEATHCVASGPGVWFVACVVIEGVLLAE